MGVTKTYGDAVVLVRRGSDGTVTRTNAIVLASRIRLRTTLDRKPVPETDPVEHLDVAYPELSAAPKGVLRTSNMEDIFRPAYNVAPWEDGQWIGYEIPFLCCAKSSGDGQPAGDWTAAGQDKDGYPVPLAQLVDLSTLIGQIDGSLEVCPDAVVPSAIVAVRAAVERIKQLEAIVNQKPEPQPEQPGEAPQAE